MSWKLTCYNVSSNLDIFSEDSSNLVQVMLPNIRDGHRFILYSDKPVGDIFYNGVGEERKKKERMSFIIYEWVYLWQEQPGERRWEK